MRRKKTYAEKLAGMTDKEFSREWERVMKEINPSRNIKQKNNTRSNSR